MARTREIIPAPLEHALLATRVLASLYATEAPKPAQLLEGALDDAAQFIRDIIEGRRYTKERLVSSKSIEYSLAYGEAIAAIEMFPQRSRMPAEVTELLMNLLGTVESLNARKPVERESVEDLTIFFKSLLEVAMHGTRKPIETYSLSK